MTKLELLKVLETVPDNAVVMTWHNEVWKPAQVEFGFLQEDDGAMTPALFVDEV